MKYLGKEASRKTSWFNLMMASWAGEHWFTQDAEARTVHFVTYNGVVYYMGYLDEDPPIVTADDIFGYVQTALAVIGIMALAAFFGLYQAGFFSFLASKYPGTWFAWLFGGAT